MICWGIQGNKALFIVFVSKMLAKRLLPYLQVISSLRNSYVYGGEGGIRTLEGLAPLLVFKTSAFNRSATSPIILNFL